MTSARRLLSQRDVLNQDLMILEFVSANLSLSQAFCLSLLAPRQAGMHEQCHQLGGEEREHTGLSLNFRREQCGLCFLIPGCKNELPLMVPVIIHELLTVNC